MSKYTVTKHYRDFPAAHRQPKHEGHCRFIHGHNWGFDITFACDELDGCGFVVDVGRLESVKRYLTDSFDHTLLLNEDDPMLDAIEGVCLEPTLAEIRTVPNCGMEGLAQWVFEGVGILIEQQADWGRRGVHVTKVTCWEDSKNCATYEP